MNLHFLPRGLNIGLIKILRSCAYLYDTRYAQDGRQRRYGVSQSLTLTLFRGVYFRFRPCVNRKIVATRKCSWHVCASSLRCQFFSDILQATAPPARVNLWAGGWLLLVLDCAGKLRSSVTRFYAARLAARYLLFPTYESVACSITTQLF